MEAIQLDYRALQAEAKALGLDVTGKKEVLAARIEEYFASLPKVERRGRPIDPNSPRQIRLSQKGLAGRGRPADPNSAWNIKQRELEEKRAAGTLKLGRKIDPNSPRQKRLALQGTLKRGRPAMIKAESAKIVVVGAIEATLPVEQQDGVIEAVIDAIDELASTHDVDAVIESIEENAIVK
jgi:hypothetical protein